jgi:GDPmannose 4,6-dehydratase
MHGKRIFITGITGQDGYYLARLMLGRGAAVFAGTRADEAETSAALREEFPELHLVRFDLLEPATIDRAIEESRPDEIFHLAGISHVADAWRQPELALRVNTLGTVHLLEALRKHAPKAHFVFAGSANSFDHSAAGPNGLTPKTPLQSTNPYSVSKTAAMQMVQCYRAHHGLRASVAILLNHTSPRRPDYFVERKIVKESVEVANGFRDRMILGSMETQRDWSWAEDLVEAMALMAARETPEDFVLGSGEIHSTGDWVHRCFARLGLNIEQHLEIDASLLHSGDRPHTFGDIAPAKRKLGWTPKLKFEDIVDRLIEAEMERG